MVMLRRQNKWSLLLAIALMVVLMLSGGLISALGNTPDMEIGKGELDEPYPFIGISIVDVDNGLLVTQVLANTAAEAAGLQAGDIITAVNGTMMDVEALHLLMEDAGVGQVILLTVERNNRTQTLSLMLREAPVMEFNLGAPQPQPNANLEANTAPVRLGVAFDMLNDVNADVYNLDMTQGALILQVIDGTPAAEVGLQVDDIVFAVNGMAVTEDITLRDRIFSHNVGEIVSLTVMRDGRLMEIDVRLAALTFEELGLD